MVGTEREIEDTLLLFSTLGKKCDNPLEPNFLI